MRRISDELYRYDKQEIVTWGNPPWKVEPGDADVVELIAQLRANSTYWWKCLSLLCPKAVRIDEDFQMNESKTSLI